MRSLLYLRPSNALRHFAKRHVHQYERKTPLEHILLRPGMYIGSTDWSVSSQWIFDSDRQCMVKRDLLLNAGLLKIFDEILVNAADNAQNDKRMTSIDVTVSTNGSDSFNVVIQNDGLGIPVVVHPKENLYVPELIFGHLLTGSNFNDKEERFTGGSHGYGAKLANIFSRSFEVDIVDPVNSRRYQQRWTNNMTQCEPAHVTELTRSTKRGYVRISFEPDLDRFPLKIEDPKGVDFSEESGFSASSYLLDFQSLLQRRCMDVASCLGLKVAFNGAPLQLTSFADYMQLYGPNPVEGSDPAVELNVSRPIICRPSAKWTVGLMESPNRQHEAVAFVNNVWTPRGGTHVQHVVSQVTKALEKAIAKKGLKAPAASVLRNYMMIFVSCQVKNPQFEGQTKESLLNKVSAFAADCELPRSFIKEAVDRLLPCIVDDITAQERARMEAALRNASSAKATKRTLAIDVPKLEDAHLAGSDYWRKCTLILTEGDSARALAVAGISALGLQGRDQFGVLPLRGKVLNVRVATQKQVAENEDLMNICKALGLNFKESYEPEAFEKSGLRYGHVLLMCDQDVDGSHIKGLLINFFHTFWPRLLECEGFLQHFATPLVKVRPRSAKGEPPKEFFNMRDYLDWMKLQADNGRARDDFLVKYYKGLGTSSSEEGREYFRRMDVHRKDYQMDPTAADRIDLAFSKTRAADRREWLKTSAAAHLDPQTIPITPQTLLSDFVDHELVQFSHYDNLRSLPHALDGLKPSQRKILFACFQRNLSEECKVAQLGGFIAERTAYHHGEASLHAAIINMAQDFVGANNVPLLLGVGQFGTRFRGGSDHASARYIYAKLSPLARLLFPREDDELLRLIEEDGKEVEPAHFLPILPMLLVNGAQGIGTGWSTSIPPHHPLHLVQHIERKLDGLPQGNLQPWFRGFTGRVFPSSSSPSTFLTEGFVRRLDKGTLEICELPIGRWTDDYKAHLFTLIQAGKLKDFKENHLEDRVSFHLQGSKAMIDALEADGWETALRLQSTVSYGNMHALRERQGALYIHKFDQPHDLLNSHYDARKELYSQRKAALLLKGRWKEELARARSSFVQALLSGRLSLHRGKTTGMEEVERDLRSLGFLPIEALRQQVFGLSVRSLEEDIKHGGFDYLLSMPLRSLTDVHAVELQRRSEEMCANLETLRARNERDLWVSDLEAFKKAYIGIYGDGH